MGELKGIPYKQKNKETGLWEWVHPKPKEYTAIKGSVAPLELKSKNKDKRHFSK